MKNKTISFSSKFSKPEKFNSQFHKVKIYVAYTGKNRNGSIISKETFEEKLIPTIYGIPIVGEWKEQNNDFGTHGGKIEISDEGIKSIETTKPYGFVDSSAKIDWELITEDDGIEREYLTADGYLWTSRYPESLNVLDGKNNQSMELNVFNGEVQDDYFEITDGEFSALCILGQEVEPCFESSHISQFNLNKDKFKEEFTLMVKELKQSFEEINNAPLDEKEVDKDDKSIEGGEENMDEVIEVVEVNDDEEIVEEIIEEVVEEVVEDTIPIVEEVDYEKKYTELQSQHDELSIELKQLKENYQILESETTLLREYRLGIEKSELEQKQDELLSQYEADLKDSVEYQSLKDEKDKYSIEDLEKELALIYVKNNAKFSKKTTDEKVKLNIETKEEKITMSPYGDLF